MCDPRASVSSTLSNIAVSVCACMLVLLAAGSFLTGFGICAGIALYQIRQDIKDSHEVVVSQVRSRWCSLLDCCFVCECLFTVHCLSQAACTFQLTLKSRRGRSPPIEAGQHMNLVQVH